MQLFMSLQFLSTKPSSAQAKFGSGGRTKAVNEPEWLNQRLGAVSGAGPAQPVVDCGGSIPHFSTALEPHFEGS